jgi:hypothetical protein
MASGKRKASPQEATPNKKAKASSVSDANAMDVDNEGKPAVIEAPQIATISLRPKSNLLRPSPDRNADLIRSDEDLLTRLAAQMRKARSILIKRISPMTPI